MLSDMRGNHFCVSTNRKNSIKLRFFLSGIGREVLFNAHSGGDWSVGEVFFAAGSSKESHQTTAVVSNKMSGG